MLDLRNSPEVTSSSNVPKRILSGAGAGDAMTFFYRRVRFGDSNTFARRRMKISPIG